MSFGEIETRWLSLTIEETGPLLERCYSWLEAYLTNEKVEKGVQQNWEWMMLNRALFQMGIYFYSTPKPTCTIHDLVRPIIQAMGKSALESDLIQLQCFFILDKLFRLNSEQGLGLSLFGFHSTSVHRLFATIYLYIIKLSYDAPPTNKAFADLVGMSLDEVNRLEPILMTQLDGGAWKPDIMPEEVVDNLCSKKSPWDDKAVFLASAQNCGVASHQNYTTKLQIARFDFFSKLKKQRDKLQATCQNADGTHLSLTH